MNQRNADTVVVDFETTGFAPRKGDRTIEVGAVMIENGKVTDHFQGLINPGFTVSEFIPIKPKQSLKKAMIV